MGAKGRRNYPWAWIVTELRSRPGKWRLFPAMVAAPIGVIERVRRRSVRALRLSDGKIYARQGVVAWRDDGTAVTDVWLRYLPTTREEP